MTDKAFCDGPVSARTGRIPWEGTAKHDLYALDGYPGFEAFEDGLLGSTWAEAVAGQQDLAIPDPRALSSSVVSDCWPRAVTSVSTSSQTIALATGGVLQVDVLGVDAEQPDIGHDLDAELMQFAHPAITGTGLDGLCPP